MPGSGGGYNKNNFALLGNGGLFSPQFGNTQSRLQLGATVPIVRDFDQLISILYLERLDFSAFYNYGGAWNGLRPVRGFDQLTAAHGYNLDLQLENKGVRFNVGIGIGTVVGDSFQSYVSTGFDALF